MRRYVVGSESSEGSQANGDAKPGGVWHAVAADTGEVACGAADLTVFDEIPWDAVRTAVLCQRCLRNVAGWDAGSS